MDWDLLCPGLCCRAIGSVKNAETGDNDRVKRVAISMLALACAVAAIASIRRPQQVEIRIVQPGPDTLDQVDLDGSGTWRVSNGLLILEKPGTPSGAIRRPAALAIFRTKPLERVLLTLDVRCTAPVDVIHRDLEIVFGYESPTRFYYAHLAGTTDAVHNGVFIVDNADRRRIDTRTPPPQLRDQEWHHVALERDGATGRIKIVVDHSANPAWELTDTTIRSGRVGFGSFDDTGEFRNISIIGGP
jgi:hypothetical protein